MKAENLTFSELFYKEVYISLCVFIFILSQGTGYKFVDSFSK
jgi:hypothetical protein